MDFLKKAALAFFALGLPMSVFAQTLSSSSFTINRQTLGASGHRVTSNGFILEGQFGQPIADSGLTSSGFQVGSGFFFFPPAVVEAVQEVVAEVGDAGGGGLLVEYFMEKRIPGFAPTDYDLNRDGYVDFIDLSILKYVVLSQVPVFLDPIPLFYAVESEIVNPDDENLIHRKYILRDPEIWGWGK